MFYLVHVTEMPPLLLFAGVAAVALVVLEYFCLGPLVWSPLGRIPGPKLYALTKWRLAYEDWKGARTRTIHRLHQQYGPVVRIGPNEVSFNSQPALRSIYGPGSRFGRTTFYRMFDVYGEQNLFTFHSPKEHGDRKKLLSNFYSKSRVLKESTSRMVEEKSRQYMKLIENSPGGISEVFTSLHYYSLDNITEFIYGASGSTSAMNGEAAHRALIDDIVHSSRRRLSWFWVHLPVVTKWMYSRGGVLGQLLQPILPMKRPTTYTGIRNFALKAVQTFIKNQGGDQKEDNNVLDKPESVLSRLWTQHTSQKADGLTDMQIASECADHFLAGIDTTSDTLMYLVWVLSLPQNAIFQERLRAEVCSLDSDSLNEHGFPKAEASDRCVFLNAVLKETLRLYAPLPSSEPRSVDAVCEVDGFTLPANTVVSIAPWTLHRNAEIFENPFEFDPDRWLGPNAAELNRWFWAFSSGGRMCIGMQ